MKRIKQILAWFIVAIATANLLASVVFRINRFLDWYSWWIKRDHKNYLGKDQSLLNLILSVFLDYCYVLPYVAIVIFVAVKIARGTYPCEGLKKGAFLGAFLGGALSSAFITLSMIPRSSDGTTEWALTWLPFIWVGYPSLVVGAALGILTAVVHRTLFRRNSDEAVSA